MKEAYGDGLYVCGERRGKTEEKEVPRDVSQTCTGKSDDGWVGGHALSLTRSN